MPRPATKRLRETTFRKNLSVLLCFESFRVIEKWDSAQEFFNFTNMGKVTSSQNTQSLLDSVTGRYAQRIILNEMVCHTAHRRNSKYTFPVKDSVFSINQPL